MEILEQAQHVLSKYPLCDNCLGRQFAMLAYGVDNKKRGETIKLLLTMQGQQQVLANDKEGIVLLKILASNGACETAKIILKKLHKRPKQSKTCYLCEGNMRRIQEYAEQAAQQLAQVEYTTFLVGVELPLEVEEREDELKSEFNLTHGEGMRNEFSREVGKILAAQTGKIVDYKNPDVVVLVNPFSSRTTLKLNPLFIGGRYRKLRRGIPQSRWFCSQCRGKGCEKCNWTGKMYEESVEELIGKTVQEDAAGTDIAFHASGREDIDARMLGTGRPFVIEVKEPKKRFLNLKKLETEINRLSKGKISVSELSFATKNDVRRLKKGESSEKMYRVTVKFSRNVTDEELAMLEKTLENMTVKQKTPTRVLHRRADKTREKHIYKANIKRLSKNTVQMKIHCEGGLYVKELITSDQGRTTPSVSQLLNTEAAPIKLDVLKVFMRDKNEKITRIPR